MKKNLLLSLLKEIEPILEQIKDNDVRWDRNSKIFRVVDNELGSSFFFEITTYESRDKGIFVVVDYKPANPNTIEPISIPARANDLQIFFTNWLGLIQGYKNVKTVFDDPIIEKYEKEFYAEFEMVEEDADKVGFDFKKQLLLDYALTEVITSLESNRNKINTNQIDELVKEAEGIKDTLTELTKKETISKISKLFAKIHKAGMKLIKDTYPILQKEIINQAVKGIIEAASNINLPNIIDTIS